MQLEWRAFKSGTIAGALAVGAAAAASMVVSALLARLLRPEELGGYYLLLQAVSVAALVAMLGTNNYLQRALAGPSARGDAAEVRSIASTALRLVALGFAGACALIAWLWLPIMHRAVDSAELAPLAGIAMLLVATQILDELVSVFFRSTGRTRLGIVLLNLPRQTLLAAALAGVWAIGRSLDLEGAASLRVLVTVATSLLGVALVWTTLGRSVAAKSPSPAVGIAGMARTSLPMMVHLLAATLFTTLDYWILAVRTNGTEEVGIFGAMTQLCGLLLLPLSAIGLVFPPLMARMYSEGRLDEMEALVRRISTLTAWVMGALVIGAAVGGPLLIRLVFGAEFERGFATFVLLAVGQALGAAAGSPGWILMMTGHQDALMKATLAGLVVKAAVMWPVVPVFGLEGVAAVSAISLGIQSAIQMAILRGATGVRSWPMLDPRPAFRRSGGSRTGGAPPAAP